ncbi:cupin domain-containing protein [Falsiroseomonas sp.]|uniref:cupin domain-containing protein n=1 Tax=Falsiroseomonas sp. TaxID=2870721 RepID=UPI00271845A6|nr:cupin domain-containing protein [Falsiroseomonas sp.]MDO9500436.1 cupin domain-containing protein [Falsiroseomonas sp.]
MAESESYHLFGNVLTFRTRPSRGAPFLLSECRSAPGAGAPPNRHPEDEEAFRILSGTYEFRVDGVVRVVGPGDWVPIPTGAPHDFRNIGAVEASMLILNWPGRQHEEFFSTLGEKVAADAPARTPSGPPPEAVLADLRRLSAACGVELLV